MVAFELICEMPRTPWILCGKIAVRMHVRESEMCGAGGSSCRVQFFGDAPPQLPPPAVSPHSGSRFCRHAGWPSACGYSPCFRGARRQPVPALPGPPPDLDHFPRPPSAYPRRGPRLTPHHSTTIGVERSQVEQSQSELNDHVFSLFSVQGCAQPVRGLDVRGGCAAV